MLDVIALGDVVPVPPLDTASGELSVRELIVAAASVAMEEKRFVDDAVVAKNAVEVALASVVLPDTLSVPVAVRFPLKKPLPATESVAKGELVPMPMLVAKYAFPVVVAPPVIVRPPF